MSEAELVKRLERLERDNRRLKRLGLAALVIAAALGTIAATRPVPSRIYAHAFDLVDNAGVVRAELTMTSLPTAHLSAQARKLLGPPGPALILGLGQSPGAGASVDASGLTVYTRQPAGDFTSAQLTATGVNVLDFGGHFAATNLSTSGLSILGNEPNISLTDSQGYSMNLGSTSLITPTTGETHQTSAASIVMFGNGKNHPVIWEAPQ